MGLSMSGLSLSHASPPHALIASRKGSKAGGSTATEQPAGGGDEAGGAGAGAPWQGGGDGGGTEQVRPAGAGGSEDLDLMYDPMLNCCARAAHEAVTYRPCKARPQHRSGVL
jgi:hypothetical protein